LGIFNANPLTKKVSHAGLTLLLEIKMNIAFIVFEKALTTGIALPLEMLTSASVLRDRQSQKQTPLKIDILSEQSGAVNMTGGLKVMAESFQLKSSRHYDLVIVPAVWGNPNPVIAKNKQLLAWLATLEGSNLLAIGTGVSLLAELGLLDGKLATTHWYYFETFEQRYPKVKLQRKAFITEANIDNSAKRNIKEGNAAVIKESKLYCAGSINSAAELILWFIRTWWGERISSVIESHYGHEINKTYDQPFLTEGGNKVFDESIAFAQHWMQQNLHKAINGELISDASGLSLRTFNRKFKSEVGITPLAYLQSLRLNAARELLKDVTLSLDEVALAVGYKDSSYFSRLFLKYMDLTPAEYRKRVRAKLFSA
jgi:transcriptional regulator GlxA family with amidase domain